MSPSNKVTLAKLCKQHYHVLPIANHRHRYLLPRCLSSRCLSSVFTTRFTRKAKQSVAFGLLLLASAFTTSLSAQTVNICDRTAVVERAILAAIPGTSDCTAVTATQLAAITELDLANMSISALQAGDFAGLTALTNLSLEANDLTTLPNGVFNDLTSLTELNLANTDLSALPAGLFNSFTSLTTLRLQGNTFTTPLPADIFDPLPNDAVIQIDLSPIGDLAVALDTSGMITINLSDAFISRDNLGNDRTLSYSAISSNNAAVATVSRSGRMLTITATGNGATTVSVTADDDADFDHIIFDILGGPGPRANVTRTISVTVEAGMSICDRTPQVELAILAAIPASPACDAVTATQLAAITGTLDLIGRGITTLQSGDFADLTSLNELELQNNALTTLEANTFSGLTSLTTLYLSENALTTLEANTFSGLTSLTQLSLGVNALTTLEANAFSGLTSLTFLGLTGNRLTTIEAGTFSALTNLTELSLHANALTIIEADTFSGLTSLGILGLGVNALTTIKANAFSGLTNLIFLNLRSNNLTTIEANTFSGLTSLNELELQNNALTTIEANAFSSLTSLTELDLTGNRLTTIEADTFSGLTSLNRLFLTSNRLTTLEANAFSGLTSLTFLGLTFNNLTTIEANTFSDLTSLTRLWLGGNDLTTIEADTFSGLTSLTELDLGDNMLSALPAGVFNALTSLTSLLLDNNDLSTLPAGVFNALTSLTRLFLGDNMLSALPAGIFDDLTSLTELALVGNTFTTPLPGDIFVNLPSTAVIQIDLSPIGDLSGVALTVGGMTTINVADAFISRADDTGTPRTPTYTITPANTAIATATETSGVVTITGAGMGTTTVSVLANDGESGAVGMLTRDIAVTVVGTGILAFNEATGDTLATPIVAEASGTDTFYVQLASAPASDVTLTLTSSDTSEGTVMPGTLTFTAAAGTTSWDTRQAVTVTAVPDNIIRDGDTFMVNFAIATAGDGDGANYTDSLTLPSVTVLVTDDDSAGLALFEEADSTTGSTEITAITTGEPDTPTTFYVQLTSQPTATVTVTITSTDTDEGTITTGASLVFSSTTWNMRQRVTVTGQDDSDVDGTQTYNVILNPASSDTNYNALADTTVTATNTDDDIVNICSRAIKVETAILTAISATSPPACDAVTSTQLAAITSLDLSNMSIGTLSSGDFAGLIGLTTLNLSSNILRTLPVGLFNPLTALTSLDLSFNSLAMLPSGIFSTLTNLTELVLWDNSSLGTLESNVFSALTNLTRLDLQNTGLSALPANLFSTLTNLTELRLHDNAFTTALPADIFDPLPDAAVIQIDLSPIGDLADISSLTVGTTTTINIASAFISRDAMGDDRPLSFITRTGGGIIATESGGVVTITASNTFTGTTDVAIFVDDDNGGPNANFRRTVVVTVVDMTVDICSRTSQVQAAILARISETNDCAAVTAIHLATITGGLSLSSMGITTLQSGDFAGLTSLDRLFLTSNRLTTIEADTFSGLTSLTLLGLGRNNLSTIGANTFSALTSLAELFLAGNALTTIEADTFSGLTSLTFLNLFDNDLTTIEADTFSGLTSLAILVLDGNALTTIEAGTFSGLTSLTQLSLDDNALTTIEANAFSGLTSLTRLFLGDNMLSALPAGIFSGFTSLSELGLVGNTFTTPLPGDIFVDLPSTAVIQIDLSPIGDLSGVALTVGGMTTINVADAFISRADDTGTPRTPTYTITPANTAIATAMESSGVVTITGAGMGATTVSVTADDSNIFGRSMYTRDIAVTVAETGILAFDEATGNTAATVVAAENSGTDTFYVQLASAPTSDVTMTVMSSAIAEGTVNPPTLTFTTMNWNTRQMLTVTAVPDEIDRDDSFTVDFAVTTGDGGNYPTSLDLPSVTVTITDDDTAGIDAYDMLTAGSEISTITTSEAAGTGNVATFYVELTSQPTGTVTVTIGGIDTTEHTLTTPASGTLTFDSTNWNTPRQAITITGVDDDIVDGDQIYDLTLTATSGGYTGVTAPTVSITNEDDDTAALSIADTTIDEDAGTATVTVTLSPMVTATGDITVDVTTIDGTATSTDYTAITSQTLTFTAGTISQTLDITISDDNIDETDETFTVMLDNLMLPTGVTTVSIADDTATVTITDDDVTPTGITLSVNPATVPETADATEITITATIDGTAVLSTETVVTVSVGGGTATSGTDYTAVPNFDLTIPALSLSATGTFMIDPNTSSTNGDTVTIGGTAPSFTTVNTATLTILEAGISVFDMASGGTSTNMVTIANENSGTMTFYVRLISAPASDVTLSVMSSDTNEGMVTPTTLTFTTANWDDRQALTITAVPDNVDRDGDSFMVDFAVTAGDGVNYTSLLDLSGVTVTITDDDTASTTIALSVSPSTIAETAGATTITVTATLDGAVVLPTATDVMVTISGGTATVTTDYTATPSTLTITIPAEAASATQTFTITPVDDGTVDNNETVTISGTAGGFTVNAATLNIVEASISVHDAMTLGSQTSTTTIAEASGTGMRYVQLASPPETGSSVTISVASSDTNEGTVSTPTLTFSDTDWNVRQPITVTAVPDNVDRDDTFMVNFAVTGGDGGNYTSSLMLPSVMVTITDDDTVSDTIGLSVSPSTVAETAASTEITVTATIDGTAVSTMPTTVTVSVGGGTATSGTDYTAVSDFTLTIPALSLSATQTFMIDPTDDTTDDNNETVMITGTAAGFTTINPATLTIVEAGISVHDAMMDGNQTSTTTIAEASGTGMLYVQLTSEPAASSSVTISVASSDTNEGTVSTPTLTFSDTNWDTRQLITITAVPDNVDRDGDSFMVDFAVTGGDGVNYTSLLDLSSVTVTVTDDDMAANTIALSVNPSTVAETAGTTTITVTATLDGTAVLPTETVVTVSVGDVSDSATEGTDYVTVNDFTLTIPALSSSATQTFTIDPTNDGPGDNNETVTISGAATINGTAATVTVTTLNIVEAGILAFEMDSGGTSITTATIVNENNGTGTLYVQLASAPAGNVTLSVESDDTNEGMVTPTTLTFTTANWDDRQALTITAVPDNVDRDGDSFMVDFAVTAGDGVNYTSLLDLSGVTVTITDDDTASTTIALSVSPSTIAETAGATTITVTATLDGAVVLPTATDVMVTISGGTATVTTDYTATPSTLTITIPAEAASATQTFTITPVDDGTVDNNETVTISGTAGGFTVNAATLNIVEASISVHDAMTLGSQTSTTTIAEASGTGMRYVQLASPPETGSSVTISVASSDTNEGTVSTPTLTFSDTDWNVRQPITVTAVPDNVDRDDTFMVNFAVTGGDGGNYTSSLMLPSVMVTITDDDTLSDTINLSVSPLSVAETADATTITVTATIEGTAVSTTDTTVTVSVGGGTATSGTDYTAVSDFTLTIPALSLSATQTFMIDPTDDTTDDNNETVMITGTAAGFTTINPATLTIVEAGISVHDAMMDGNQTSTTTIAEASGTGMLYVQLTSEPAASSSVTISVASSDTNEGTVSTPTLTFSDTNWDTRQLITITAVPDNVDRDGDSFMVDFAVMSGDSANYTSSLMLPSVMVTVTDDDTVGLTVVDGGGVTTSEGSATPDTFTVVLDSEPTATVTVEITGLRAGEHSLTPSSTLTFTTTDWNRAQTVTLTGVDDNDVDGDQTYDLTLTPTGGGYGGVMAETVSITNTDDDTATLSIADLSVDENAGTATLTVTLTPAVTAGDIEVDLTTTDGTATSTDYTALTSQTLTFTAGSTSETLDITINDDSIDELDETFTVMLDTLVQPTGVTTVSIADSTATVTITDDDTAGIALFDMATGTDAPSITTSEGATTDTFYVALESQPTDTVTVTVTSGDPSEGTITTGASLTFTTTDWNSRQPVTVTGQNDDDVDGDQTYDLTLTATGGGYNSVTAQTVSVTNTDDDTAALSIADISVNENAGMATVTVTLTPAVTAGTVTVDGTIADGTATIAGGDYTAITSQTLTFTAGSTSETLDITINDDTIDELDETFTVTLDNLVLPTTVTGDVSITDATATVTITDDDTLSDTINLSVSPLSVAETADATTITVTATIEGTAVSTTDTTVTVSVGGGTATSGTDYTAVSDFTLTIPALSLSATQTFMIDPTEDTTDDNNETVMITGTAGGFATVTPATLTIVEAGISVHDAMTLGSQTSTTTIAEASGTGMLYVQLTSPPAGNVTLSVESDDTNEGTVSTPTLTFSDTNWDTRQLITITAVPDNVDRDGDSFMVDFAVMSGDSANYTSSLMLPSVMVTVTDDDTVGLTVVDGGGVTTSEGSATPDTFTVVLDSEPTATVTVEITGLRAGEHSLTPSSTLTFTTTDWNRAQTVTLTGVDDNDVDGDQTYDLTLTPTGGGYGGVMAETVSITNTDDDTATLSIADLSVDENAGTATLTVTLTPAVTAGDIEVDLTTTDGTATSTDYTALTSQTLTFTAGSTSETLDITINDDSIDELDETFTVMLDTLVQPTGVTTVSIADSTATVTITDDDTAGIALFDMATGTDAPSITTSEGATTDTFYVALESQPTDTVTVTVTSGDPSEGTITTGASLTFTTTDWNSRQPVTVTGQNDDDVDGDQTYDLTLTATGGGYNSVTAQTVSVTNTDDDTAALSIADISVNENAGMATVTVTLTPAVTAGTVTVDGTIADGTATIAGGDYTAITSQTLTFTAGSTSETLDITINDDTIDELDETFTVTLDNLVLPTTVTGDVSITDATATVTITDDDTLSDTINLSVSPLSVAETADATTITVTATIEGTAVSTMPTTVTVSVGGGTATSGTDYTAVSDFTLTIPALSLSATQTFMIDPTDDTTDDNNETVMITGTAGGFTINATTLTIVEAGILVYDAMSAGNPISTATIAEASSDTFYVELASQPAGNVTLTLTSDDTNEGTVTPATLTFTTMNWDARQALTVTAVNDNIDRDGDSFMVDFMITSGDSANYTSSLDLPSVAVTVSDDDTPSTDITLTISRDSIQETAGETSITVTAALGGAVSTIPTEVTVTVGGGTGMNEATVTIDYTLSIPTATLIITIPALETSSNGVFTITPIADNENDNEETITISGEATINGNSVTVNTATLTITGFSEEEQQVIEQTVAAQASSVTQVVSENIGSFLASRTSAPAPAPAPAPDGGGGGDINRENFTSIDWQDWQERFAKLAYEGLKRMDSGADMSLDWALKAAGGDGRLLMPLSIESLTLWAAGGRLKTKGDGMGEYDGGVNSFVVGVDTNLINNWLLGMAASYSDSQVDYTMDGAPIGTTEQNLFSVHPFLSHSLPEHGLTLWVTGGYGVGDIDFSHTTNGEAASDVTQWMAAGGIEKHIITNTLWQGALRIKGLWGNATVDATEYDNGVDIRKVESTFWRARMESEMGYNFQLPGANVRPYALIGGRWDHNDAIVSGDEWHIDIGGGVEVLSGNAFALNISLHTQVTDGDTEEDSIVGTGSLTYDIGHDRQGLQITLSRPLNNTSPAWDQHSFNEVTDKVSGVKSAPLTSELAYGWTVRPLALKGALQTYVQNSFDSHDRHYAVGLELVVNALTLNFETGYSEADSTGLESLFKTKIRW